MCERLLSLATSPAHLFPAWKIRDLGKRAGPCAKTKNLVRVPRPAYPAPHKYYEEKSMAMHFSMS